MWLIVLIPNTEPDEWRDMLRHPAAWLPVALVALSFAGMAWASGVDWSDRISGFASFAKLLAIPVLIVQFRNSPRANWVLIGFLISCSLVLLSSWMMVLTGMKAFTRGSTSYGVPVRDYIVQSQEFILCAVGLIYLVYLRIRERSLLWALALAVLAILFLVNVMFVAPSRTGLVTVPVLLVILVLAHCRWTISVATWLRDHCGCSRGFRRIAEDSGPHPRYRHRGAGLSHASENHIRGRARSISGPQRSASSRKRR